MSEQSNATKRVSEVLKSELESQILAEKDAVVLTGHESKVVENYYPEERAATASDVHWDEKRFDGFLKRLGALDGSKAA